MEMCSSDYIYQERKSEKLMTKLGLDKLLSMGQIQPAPCFINYYQKRVLHIHLYIVYACFQDTKAEFNSSIVLAETLGPAEPKTLYRNISGPLELPSQKTVSTKSQAREFKEWKQETETHDL